MKKKLAEFSKPKLVGLNTTESEYGENITKDDKCKVNLGWNKIVEL